MNSKAPIVGQKENRLWVAIDPVTKIVPALHIGKRTAERIVVELRDKIARLTLKVESADRGRAERVDIAVKAFELSQSLAEKWVTADYATKRHILEIVCLNFRLVDVTLVPTMRKPFDVLAKGLSVQSGRGDWI